MPVVRTLPNKHRRMVGAWCFVDHYQGDVSMRVPPHPHTALQTVTWLVRGEVRHRDSLGSDQLIRPGQLNLMTAGRGIAHAEDSTEPAGSAMPMHGVQLWVALPSAAAGVEPAFAHHADLPSLVDGPVSTKLLAGTVSGVTAPAGTYTALVGAEVSFAAQARTELALEPDFEYAALTLTGEVAVDGQELPYGPLLYLGTGRRRLQLSGSPAAKLLLIGGEPFAEQIVMWWNFIGRSHDEIVAAREDWAAERRFGSVDYEGARLPAPELPISRLVPKGRVR